MRVSGKLATGLRDFWEPSMLYELTVRIAFPSQLRSKLYKLLFTLALWHAANSPLLKLMPAVTPARGGTILNFRASFLHLLPVQQKPYSPATIPSRPSQVWTLEAEERWKVQQVLKHEGEPKIALWHYSCNGDVSPICPVPHCQSC